MKFLLSASLIASAAAFTPSSSTVGSSTKLSASFENEVGAQIPLGFFDPLGIVADGDEENFNRLRYVELKHGRIAMLAVVGYLTTYAGLRFPGAEDIPSGFKALDSLPSMVWLQMGFTVGLMEIMNRDIGMSTFPGDFRNGALDFGWDAQTDEWKKKKRSIELNNGRAAQMGIFALMVHEKIGNIDSILP